MERSENFKGVAKRVFVGQFGLLGSYAAEVRRTNPGSTIILTLGELVFKGIYVCFEACKKGFLAGCRPVICIDGCFLKGDFGGQLLAAVGIDGNDCIFPIAHAVVEVENNDSWAWFRKLLGEDLSIENTYGLTFMSDRQKGLENIVSHLFLLAEHRFCVRHMYTNFFRKDFKSLKLRDLLWRAAKSTYLAEFKYWMDKLKNEDQAAWEWLSAKPAEQWSKSHFQTISKCDMLLNNLCECFNNYIKEERGKDILNLLQGIQNKIMVRMYKRRDLVAKVVGDICPKIHKKLDANTKESFYWRSLYNGDMQYQVSGPYSDGQFVVDIGSRTCTCRKWDLSGVPCPHAVASIREWGKDPLQFVDECYKVTTYLRAYENPIYPINGKKMWPPSGFEPVKPPYWFTKKRGRKQMKRRIGIEEASMAKTKTKKLDRRGDGSKKMKCTVCGKLGHNKRFHSSSKIHEDENQHGDGFGLGASSRAHVGEHVAYSQPASSLSGIMQQEIPASFSQPYGSTGQRTRKNFTPRRRLKSTGNLVSTPTLKDAWNNMMNK